MFRVRNVTRRLKSIHYHGDTVRIIYVAMGVIIIATLPFLKNDLPLPIIFYIFAVLALLIFAGFTSPSSKSIIKGDFIVSAFALVYFCYEAVIAYNPSELDLFFFVNTLLSTLSAFSLYFSSKTLRGSLNPPTPVDPPPPDPMGM